MSGKTEINAASCGVHSQIIQLAEEEYFTYVRKSLQNFVTNGFLQQMFSKASDNLVDKAKLLVNTFGKAANPNYFQAQADMTNIQPKTLSLIFSIATHAASEGWYAYKTSLMIQESEVLAQTLADESDSDNDTEADDVNIIIEDIPATPITSTPNPVSNTSTKLPDLAKSPVDPAVASEIIRKEKINKSKKVTHILTGYTPLEDEQQRIHEIVVYDIPYTWSPEHILAELKLWENTIEVSIKRQHNWNLHERKQREKFQAVIHDIPEEMTISTLWADHAPTDFLRTSYARSFKIIQTGKGKRKLMAYFENWETVRSVIENPQVFPPNGKELKWCRYSSPNLNKSRKTQGIPDRNKEVPNNRLSKKSPKTQPEASKMNSKLTKFRLQKHNSNNRLNKKRKGGSDSNKEVLAKILELLQKLV
ncbi:hypothetical protein C1646_774045 [Rhizophagus diaphanus]|nr:hypothetical protein C1646_774045 [Rhizophagus diaphanus] [Rhizophagus sp. MUCL 43196]